MAEKNTHSILETIKKKMLKLDQKAEKKEEVPNVVNSNSEDEFEDISSSDNKKSKAVESKAEVASVVDQKFEDDLGIDIEKFEEKKDLSIKKSTEKTSGIESFKDFNLDDLDLDNEEKTFAPSAINPPARKESGAVVMPDPVLDVSEIEKSEDEVEVEDNGVSGKTSQVVAGDVGPVDWLGNPINSSVTESESEEELLEDSEDHEDEEDQEEQEEDDHDEDLEDHEDDEENFEEDHDEQEEDDHDEDLEDHEDEEENFEEDHDEQEEDDHDEDLEDHEDDEEGFEEYHEEDHEEQEEDNHDEDLEEDDLELPNFEEEEEIVNQTMESSSKELPSFDAHLEDDKMSIKTEEQSFLKQPEPKIDDLDLDILEKLEPKSELQKETVSEMPKDDFDFADLEQEDDIFAQVKNEEIEQQTVFEATKEEVKELDPLGFNSNPEQEILWDKKLEDSNQPQIQKHEIDLEFEKELMGFSANTSETSMPLKAQPTMNFMPMEKEKSQKFESDKLVSQPVKSQEYESTVRQVSDSVKKLVDAKNVVSGISSFSQSPALAELALHLMEPKIEKWFNDNLPDLVEKVVREEIKKMIPKE